MNKTRRKTLEEIISTLETARDLLTEVAEEEWEAFDNLPENFQYSEMGETMSETADDLEENRDNLDYIIENLQEYV